MKNLVVFLMICFFPTFVTAQNIVDSSSVEKSTFFQGFRATGYYTPFAKNNLKGETEIVHSVCLDFSTETNWSHHHMSFDVFNNSLNTLHGVFLPDDNDIYIIGVKSLNSSYQAFGVGFEHTVEGNFYYIHAFVEFGLDFEKGTQASPYAALGVSIGIPMLHLGKKE